MTTLPTYPEALNEIDRLRIQNQALRKALTPFANLTIEGEDADNTINRRDYPLLVERILAARSALA